MYIKHHTVKELSVHTRQRGSSQTMPIVTQSQTLLRNLTISQQWVLIYFLMLPCHQSNTAAEIELFFLQGNQIGLG